MGSVVHARANVVHVMEIEANVREDAVEVFAFQIL
jgi:hypothetical protein